MSGYPPPLGNAFFTDYTGPNLPGLPHLAQYPHQPRSKTSSQGHVQAGTAANPQYANAYSFNSNWQENHTTPGMNRYAAPPFTEGIQKPDSVSPWPPISLDFLPQHPAVSQTSTKVPQPSFGASSNKEANVLPKSQTARLGEPEEMEPESTPATLPVVHTLPMSDLEDGELSDGNNSEDLEASSAVEHCAKSIPQSFTGESSQRSMNDRATSSDKHTIPARVHHHGVTATSSTNGVLEAMTTQISRTTNETKDLPPSSDDSFKNGRSTQPSAQVSNEPCLGDSKLQQAKDTLQSLHANGIDYLHLVREGLSSSLLERIYSELGIRISSKDLAAAKGINEERARRSQGGEQTAQDASKSPSFQKTNKLLAQQPSTGLETMEDQSQQGKPNNRAGAVPNLQNNPVNHKRSNPSTTANDKVYDRKDHIARMLAARAGKPVATTNTPAPSSAAPASKPGILPESARKIGASTDPAQVEQTSADNPQKVPGVEVSAIDPLRQLGAAMNLTVTIPGPENTTSHIIPKAPAAAHVVDTEAKKKAQTELARRKMEALVNRNSKSREEIASIVLPLSANESALSSSNENALPNNAISRPTPNRPQIPIASIAQQAPPTPRSSYFSLTPGRQFSLPGLFMPSEPQAPPVHDSVRDGTRSEQGTISVTTSNQVPTQPATGISLPLAPASISDKQITKMNVSEIPGGVSANTEVVNNTRKRQKAADFIDAPSTRVKRLFGHSGDSSVVIEVSEDEALDGSHDGMDIDTAQDVYGSMRGVVNGSQPVQQPSAPDTQVHRRNSVLTSQLATKVTMTPPVAQAYGKENDGLRSKEMEIELMKRKIAEVEQRRKAKQTNSRAQTPATSRVVSSPKESRASSEVVETSRASLTPNAAVVGKGRIEESGLVTSVRKSESPRLKQVLPNQQMIEEQRAQEVEEQFQLESEQQQSQLQVHQRRIEEHQERELTEEKNPQLRAEGLEEKRIRELQEEKEALQLEEQNKRQLEAQLAREASQQRQIELERMTAEDVEKAHKMQRKADIEAGLPILDAEVEKTEQKLLYLRSQIKDLESDLQRGIEGRRNLVEELQALTTAPDTSLGGSQVGYGGSANDNNSEGPHHTIVPAKRTPSLAADDELSSSVEQTLPPDANPSKDSVAALPSVGRSTARGELEEDVMDVSMSDLDGGELSDYNLASTTHAQFVKHLADGEDTYEPPTSIDVQQLPPAVPSPIRLHQDELGGSLVDLSAAPAAQGKSPSDSLIQLSERSASIAPATHRSKHAQDISSGRGPSASSEFTDESDDYEPPEPVSSAVSAQIDEDRIQGDAQRDTIILATDEKQSPKLIAEPEVLVSAEVASYAPELPPKELHTKFRQSNGRFTPYESPLKQFKSYRYHSSFLDDIKEGFRSLTYSHDIKPDEPVCPYEIGGTCNDQSCPYQHFRNMSLSDNMILLQLGTAPVGLSQEQQDAYNEGLRNVIRDIRSRNVRDFNAMAADITTYRVNFIGDNTKILPL